MTELEFRQFVANKKIGILGAGVSNLPLISWLSEMGGIITVRDKNEKLTLPDGITPDRVVLGEKYLEDIDEDILFRSPGMRFDEKGIEKAVKRGAYLTSEIEMLFELCPAKIIAVTGSDGKTTTTTLISEMLKAEGKKVWLGGNIGTPLCHRAFEMDKDDIVVLELSSFQLHTMKKSSAVAVVTNLAPNHLDKHKDFEEYIEAKKNVFLYQKSGDRVVLNFDNEITKAFEKEASGEVVFFSKKGEKVKGATEKEGKIYFNGELILDKRDIKLPGEHNVENYMAAISAVYGTVSKETVLKVAKTFGGVRHRIEFVREVNGVSFYNDSIGTSPSRSTAGLLSFDKKIILIAGGYDKHLDYTDFGKTVAKRVKTLVLTGDTAEKIKAATLLAKKDMEIIYCNEFDNTVKAAFDAATEGDVVMLSPASASFDKFKNFEERGNRFCELVNSL